MKSLLSKDETTKLLEALRSSGQVQATFAEINGINPKNLLFYKINIKQKVLIL